MLGIILTAPPEQMGVNDDKQMNSIIKPFTDKFLTIIFAVMFKEKLKLNA